MKILAIETSCDETAVSIVEVSGAFPDAEYEVLGTGLYSQTDIHAEFGGVFPMMAKRAHSENLIPMLQKALTEAELLEAGGDALSEEVLSELQHILEREPALYAALTTFLEAYTVPEFDCIAVTNGPGLAPALWVGVNFAKALAKATGIPVIPVNHMEGHILASVYDVVEDNKLASVAFPALALLISGGHTELILMTDWTHHEKIGHTRDDAVGEAIDKVARLLDLPYPGGPLMDKKAQVAVKKQLPLYAPDLPRPMLSSGDFDMSFSGLKTAVRYLLTNVQLTEDEQTAFARDFMTAVCDVLLAKTSAAITEYGCKTCIVGGGVSASSFLRERFKSYFAEELSDCELYFPDPALSTGNAVMIALAGHAHIDTKRTAKSVERIQADGNKSL